MCKRLSCVALWQYNRKSCSWKCRQRFKGVNLPSLIPGKRGRKGERAWFQPFAHALNYGGIPLLMHIIDTHLTTCDITTFTAAAALLHTLTIGASMSSVVEDLDHCLSYALQQLASPELKLKPEQQSVIELVYRGKDVFVWPPRGFGELIHYHTLPLCLTAS